MRKIIPCAVVVACLATAAQATQQYTIEYAANSPIKSIPLNNATLVVERYDYEKPHGYVRIKTNTQKAFSVNHGQDFEVVGIVGERKYNARCSGYATPTRQKIKISCDKF